MFCLISRIKCYEMFSTEVFMDEKDRLFLKYYQYIMCLVEISIVETIFYTDYWHFTRTTNLPLKPLKCQNKYRIFVVL